MHIRGGCRITKPFMSEIALGKQCRKEFIWKFPFPFLKSSISADFLNSINELPLCTWEGIYASSTRNQERSQESSCVPDSYWNQDAKLRRGDHSSLVSPPLGCLPVKVAMSANLIKRWCGGEDGKKAAVEIADKNCTSRGWKLNILYALGRKKWTTDLKSPFSREHQKRIDKTISTIPSTKEGRTSHKISAVSTEKCTQGMSDKKRERLLHLLVLSQMDALR